MLWWVMAYVMVVDFVVTGDIMIGVMVDVKTTGVIMDVIVNGVMTCVIVNMSGLC